MNLYLYSNTLVVASSKSEAVDKFKRKLDYVNLSEFGEWDIEEISDVDGYAICVNSK